MMASRSRQRARTWLADDYYLIAYDVQACRFRVSDHVARLGLAAGLLAELVFHNVARIEGDRICIRRDRFPQEAKAHVVHARIAAESRARPVSHWLRCLSSLSYEDVVERMSWSRQVTEKHVRRLPSFRPAVVYEPADLKSAGWPEARVAGSVRDRCLQGPQDIVLAGLVVATGLAGHVFYEREADSEFARDAVADLDPPLPDLITHTEAAVGEVALNPNQ